MTLVEELVLLSIDENKRKFSWSASNLLKYGLKGIILIELVNKNRIEIIGNKFNMDKNKLNKSSII